MRTIEQENAWLKIEVQRWKEAAEYWKLRYEMKSLPRTNYKRNPTDSIRSKNGVKTPEYLTWIRMKTRCNNKNYPRYFDHGGRGIGICDRWLNSFDNFLSDMGKRPSPKHSLDRIDNNGNYEPNNCRWATFSQQATNRRNTTIVTYNGETKSITEWSHQLNIERPILYSRIYKLGWSPEKAFSIKKNSRKTISKSIGN